MRNSTATGTNFFAWAAGEAERSPRFRREVDRLRRLAAGAARGGYPRTTGPLTGHEWDELEQRFQHWQSLPQPERPRAWKHTQLPTDDGLRHLRDYRRGCHKLAPAYLGCEQDPVLVHELVRRAGYLASAPAAGPPAPTGSGASSLAAHISGASWGAGATALRQAWYRARCRNRLWGTSAAFLL